MTNKLSIQLVSCSPRRKEILSRIYDEVLVTELETDETAPKGMSFFDVPAFLAEQKMQNFLKNELPLLDKVVTADTIVCYPDSSIILGKPKNTDEAKDMLFYHFGKEHLVISAVCYYDTKLKIKKIITDQVNVRFKATNQIPEEIVNKYINLLPPQGPMDKAGAYGIQEIEVKEYMVEKVNGDINTVIGFPLEKFMSVIINGSS